jgi:hypothetical protein
MFEDLARRIHATVERPRTLRYNDDDPAIKAQLLARSREELDWIVYGYFFEAEFEVGLYYLPYALEDLAAMIEGYDEYARTAVGWVASYSQPLQDLGLLADTLQCLVVIFETWLDAFRPRSAPEVEHMPESWRFAGLLPGGDCRDGYLSAVYADDLKLLTGESLAGYILRRWNGESRRPTWSAHLIDMGARARGAEPLLFFPGPLYWSAEVRSLLGDTALLRKHYERAEPVWREHSMPDWYCDMAKRLLLAGS